MKDLDFDELDRAVNSLITSVPGDQTPVDTVKTVTLDATPPTPLAPPTPPRPLAARRSTGRFMDVVHPSSDMHSSGSTPAPGRISRQGTAVTPPAPSVATSTPEPVSSTPDREAPIVAPEPPVSTDWPDPLDFHGSATTPQTVSDTMQSTELSSNSDTPVNFDSRPLNQPEPDEDDDINRIADDINHSLGQETEAPQTSPFLSDAKVDKRPLGAFSAEPAVAATIEAPADLTPPPEADEAVVPPASSPVLSKEEEDDPQTPLESAPLPAELQSDLLSIESGGDEAQASETPQPIGPTSIVQQYKEQPSTGDVQTGNIYDTSSYHQAIAHPAKKKSGWMWVLWTAVLLVVGAGAGAAVYFYVLPHL